MSWSIVMLVYKVCSPLIFKQREKCHRTMNAVNAASGRRVVTLGLPDKCRSFTVPVAG